MGADAVRAAFAAQAHWCALLDSPLTAALCRAAGERLDAATAIGRRLLSWQGDPAPEADNVPARTCAAFHFLVRAGEAPALARLYPPAPVPDEAALWSEAAPLLRTHAVIFHSFLDNAPQTNEVGRSAPLMAGLQVVAARFRMPIGLFELGSSAGLNLLLDRYAHDLGGLAAGEPSSPVRLAPDWTGRPPPDADVRVVSRLGVDLSPRDVRRDAERLLAFVWADQRPRLARLEAALAIAAADPARVERGEAGEWLEGVLPAASSEGIVRVVFHSLAFQYFPAATQRRIERLLERLGGQAEPARPLAWLRYEFGPGDAEATLRLRTWPGEEAHLAWVHAHGATVRWLG